MLKKFTFFFSKFVVNNSVEKPLDVKPWKKEQMFVRMLDFSNLFFLLWMNCMLQKPSMPTNFWILSFCHGFSNFPLFECETLSTAIIEMYRNTHGPNRKEQTRWKKVSVQKAAQRRTKTMKFLMNLNYAWSNIMSLRYNWLFL